MLDISALSGLTSLTRLELTGNQITDIGALKGLTSLTGLDLRFNADLSDAALLEAKGVVVNNELFSPCP